MTRAITATFIVFLALGQQALAQSTVTLESFDLDSSGEEITSEMRDCLLDPESCESEEFGGGAAITLEDVLNLGVIDRSEVETAAGKTVEERSAEIGDLPSIDIEVFFAYDSDALTPSAQAKLSELVHALSDPRLNDYRLLFIGHTDAVGGMAYNAALSQRRAERVAEYVTETLAIDPARVDATGVGFSRLKDPQKPTSGVNRRVQLVLLPL